MVFDYKATSKRLKVPGKVLNKLEREATAEFSGDAMLRELHVLRALRSYARTSK